jgi:hypothetical protein
MLMPLNSDFDYKELYTCLDNVKIWNGAWQANICASSRLGDGI